MRRCALLVAIYGLGFCDLAIAVNDGGVVLESDGLAGFPLGGFYL
jgi:hypothetical protein